MLKKLRFAGILTRLQNNPSHQISQSPLSPSNSTSGDYAHSVVDPRYKTIFNQFKKNYKNLKFLPFLILGLIIITVIFFITTNLTKSKNNTVAGTQNNKVNIQKAKATQLLNKEFLFPLKDATGKEISKLKFFIQSAEKRDEIIVKGQKATSVQGRTFLILNLKITNDYNRSIQINARDYLRLIVNNSSEKLAPDIHNDPVEIQAISTKLTRLGFPINDTDKNLTLQVGEIEGNKELIKLEPK